KVADPITKDFLHILGRLRIMGVDHCPFLQQRLNVVQRRCLTNIIGMWLEGKTPDGDYLAFEIVLEVFLDPSKELGFLVLVYVHNRLQDSEVVGGILGRLGQRLDVFGKATSAVSDTREEKAFPYSAVCPNPFPDSIYVGT